MSSCRGCIRNFSPHRALDIHLHDEHQDTVERERTARGSGRYIPRYSGGGLDTGRICVNRVTDYSTLMAAEVRGRGGGSREA